MHFPNTNPKCIFSSSKYVARLQAGERPLQVLQNLQISDGDKNGSMTLLRDQIVVQVSFYCNKQEIFPSINKNVEFVCLFNFAFSLTLSVAMKYAVQLWCVRLIIGKEFVR